MDKWGQIPLLSQTDGGDKRWRVRPVFLVLVAVVMVVAGLAIFAEQSAAQPPPQTRDLRAEFDNVKIPSGAHALHEVETKEKIGAILVENRYTATILAPAILAHYRDQLTQHGWTYRTSFHSGTNMGEDYCKGRLLASIEILPSASELSIGYAFSIGWSGVSEHECS
jgi:hypothetical protein